MSALALTAGREIRETMRHRTFWIVNAVLFSGVLRGGGPSVGHQLGERAPTLSRWSPRRRGFATRSNRHGRATM